jgi:replication factor A1
MQMHYALVSDLVSQEEFNCRVLDKIEKSGELLDEETASMVVVDELGRHHVKIKDIPLKAGLISFFCRVLAVTPAREFTRSSGEPGMVADLLVGDETGQCRVVLWDEKAGAVEELAIGEVLECIGRPSPSKINQGFDVHAMALRQASCEISCPGSLRSPLSAAEERCGPFEVRCLACGPVRTFTRRDGQQGEMAEGLVGNEAGTVRVVVWAPSILQGIERGMCIRISGARNVARPGGFEYHLDENALIEEVDCTINVPITPLAQIRPGETISIRGEIQRVEPMRSVTSKRGDAMLVRNVIISEGSASVRLALWSEKAEIPLLPGDHVEVYHANTRAGRQSEAEISAGRGSVVLRVSGDIVEGSLEGTIIGTRYGRAIDTGCEWYLLVGDLPISSEVRIQGVVEGHRVRPLTWVPVPLEKGPLEERANALRTVLKNGL